MAKLRTSRNKRKSHLPTLFCLQNFIGKKVKVKMWSGWYGVKRGMVTDADPYYLTLNDKKTIRREQISNIKLDKRKSKSYLDHI